MVSQFIKYLLLIGFVFVLEISISTVEAMKSFPDPMRFDSSGLNPREDVKFFLYTRAYPNNPKQLYVDDKRSLSNSGYDIGKPTKFVTHGWKQDGGQGSGGSCIAAVKKGFLHHDFNVIVVDWSKFSHEEEYADAAPKVLGVAEYVAKMIDFLVDQGSNPDEMTIAGHSLGGHIAGLAAHKAKSNPGHVVAMDPANPGFSKQNKEGRVSVVDAPVVETIHTATNTLGYKKIVGRIDYFPNGGKSQPGDCEQKDKDTKGFCSHLRACDYYGEALANPQQWLAQSCHSNEQLEEDECKGNQIVPFASWTNKIERPDGIYILRTNDKAPYGLGTSGVN